MPFFPYNIFEGLAVQSHVRGVNPTRLFLARYSIPATTADAASTTGVHAAVTDNGAAQSVTTAITNPPSPRQITVTSGGTAANITAQQVTIKGTNYLGNVIQETLPAFTAATATTVSSVTFFATVTQIIIPPIGTGVTVAVGYGAASGAAVASTTAVHAAVTDNAALQVITTAITNPTTPRNITATSGGTAANITAQQVTIKGTDYGGNVIQETLPAFTAGAATTVTGNKAFATVTEIDQPAIGVGVTVSYGFGSKLGLPYKLARNQVQAAYLGLAREATLPTVTSDPANLSGNTVALASALTGAQVDLILQVP